MDQWDPGDMSDILVLVIGAMSSPQWVPNGGWRWSFLMGRIRGSAAMFGIHSHPSDCNVWLEWLVWINGTQGTCQTPRIGDGGHDRHSMGPK